MSDLLPLSPAGPGDAAPGVSRQMGKTTMGAYEKTFSLAQTLVGALSSPFEPGEAASDVASRLAIRQVFFTGFEALPLVERHRRLRRRDIDHPDADHGRVSFPAR